MCPIGKSETHCSVRAVTGREEGGEGRISRSRNFKPTTHTARDRGNGKAKSGYI